MKNVIKQIAQESKETLVEEGKKILRGVITGKELVADAKMMSPEEMAQKQQEDERKKQAEMQKVREQGRNVEGEMEQIRQEKKQKEEEEEKVFLEKIERQRRAEEEERQSFVMEVASSPGGPAKRKKSRGSAFARGKKQPSQAEMTATGEFSKKPD
ncbi:hypothetical protein KJ909_02635 [Patescibacteria group bacterium]|nr:hypothetical protein [Patescibacteria group bacterium]